MAPAPSFLSLPGEIRNHIYEAYIDECEAIELIRNRAHPPPLSQVDRQVREEFSSVWADRWTNLPKVVVIKAVVFDLNFYFLRSFLETSSLPALTQIQARLVFTRATAFLSKGGVQQLIAQSAISRHAPSLPRWASRKYNPLVGLSIHYVASFYPENLEFDKTRLAQEIQATTEEGVAPIQAAIETALRDRDNVELLHSP